MKAGVYNDTNDVDLNAIYRPQNQSYGTFYAVATAYDHETTKGIKMKKLTILFLLLTCGMCLGQKKLGDENRGLHFDIAIAPAWLPLDGSEINLVEAQPMFGLTKTFDLGIDLSPGLYVFGNLAAKNGDDKNWNLGVAAYLKIYRGGGVGLGYRVLQESVGIQKPSKKNMALIFGLNI